MGDVRMADISHLLSVFCLLASALWLLTSAAHCQTMPTQVFAFFLHYPQIPADRFLEEAAL